MRLLLLLLVSTLAPHRIVSTAPAITEILFALGAGAQVVGDTTYCNYPEAAKTKAKIGGFSTPSVELILALNPDLVFMVDRTSDVAEKLRQSRRIDVVTVKTESVDGVYRSIQTIADKIGLAQNGKSLVQSIDKEIRANQAPPAAKRPKVLFVVGRTPGAIADLIVVGHGTYLSELIELAGGDNIAADAAIPYAHFSFEELIHRDPDIIIDMGHDGMVTDAEKRSVKQLWQKYAFLRAVKNDAIFPISADYFITPGPRVGQAVRDLRKIFSR